MKITTRGALGAAAALAFAASSADAATFWTVNFTPLNGSGVTGNALLTLNDDATRLTVEINAFGLVPDRNHPGHIHGRFDDDKFPIDSTVPTLAQDSDGDGFIEVAEGAASYGPIILPLSDLTDPGPEAPNGILRYTQSFDLLDDSIYADSDMDGVADFERTDLLGDDLKSLDLREIVLHGMFVPAGAGAGTPGEVDGNNGYLAVLPAASGEIVFAGNVAPVPEPATWAMMIAGFGMVGGAMRSARRAKVRYAPAKS